jgi:hypothetical protein
MPAVDISLQPAPAVGSSTLDIKPATYSPGAGTENGGQFRIHCNYSHMSNDDPIVYPNQEGASHSHTFFGNTSVNYKTSIDTLPNVGNSTCFGGIANRSGYWVPSLIDTSQNKPLKPEWALFYYKTGHPDKVIAPPKGLRMIAGVASAQTPQNGDIEVVRYMCNEVYTGRQETIPACSGDLLIQVSFPSCWDGVNLDSPDHKSHMAYDTGAGCPASHPKVIPDITFGIHYQVSSTTNLRLASDNYVGGKNGNSAHGDWMNGWDQNVLNTFVTNCLKGRKDCHANLLGNGKELF